MRSFPTAISVQTQVLKKKIRNAEVEHYKFIFCVGKAERDTNSVDVRASGGKNEGM